MTRPKPERRREVFRCAIYTRKSTEEGLDQEFNSLDAQRDSGEAYIRSQANEGWICLTEHYDDGGYTGGNMDRPALKRLLADIEAGRVDCVVVYKVDRLSRSLLDFARMMEAFERHEISFVSVTQQFNTASSMGRLILNVLLSFAQFEREMISERTRDKIAAARRKGKWAGGMPILGYDVENTKLIVNELEADRVRKIYLLYLEFQSILSVVQELDRRGWATKAWTTRKGIFRGGRPFTKTALYQLLTNVTYTGQIRYKTEVHLGEHLPILDQELFDRVQTVLRRNGRASTSPSRIKNPALLRGLLRCKACNCSMTPTYSSKGPRRYRYYACANAQKRGWSHCPSPSVSATKIEAFVVDQIRGIGRDPALVAATLAQVRVQSEEALRGLERERAALERQRRDDDAKLHGLATALASEDGTARAADLLERMSAAERRLAEISRERERLSGISDQAVTKSLAEFDSVWSALSPREQVGLVSLLIERIDHDGREASVAITFGPSGIKSLAAQLVKQEDAA